MRCSIFSVLLLVATLSFLDVGLGHNAYADFNNQEFSKLLSCFSGKVALMQGKSKFDFAVSGLPKQQIHKLFIDKHRLAKPNLDEAKVLPHLLFDVSEPGYNKSMVGALGGMASTIGRQNNVELLIFLHDLAVEFIANAKKGVAPGWGYPILKNFLDKTAMDELVSGEILAYATHALGTADPLLKGGSSNDSGPLSYYFPLSGQVYSRASGNPSSIARRLSPIFQHYETSIKRAKTVHGKLLAIAELLRTLEVYHIFPDGNTRTNAFLMLTKLLLENNLPPAILEDPNMFGYMNLRSLANAIYVGMWNFLNESEEFYRKLLRDECGGAEKESQHIKKAGGVFPSFTNQERKNSTMTEDMEDIQLGTEPSEMKTSDSDHDIEMALFDFRKDFSLEFDEDYIPYFKMVSQETPLRSNILKGIQEGKVNTPSYGDSLLLTQAITLQDFESVDLLLKHGADPIAGSAGPIREAIRIDDHSTFYTMIDLIRSKKNTVDSAVILQLCLELAPNPSSGGLLATLLSLLEKGVLENYMADALASSNLQAVEMFVAAGFETTLGKSNHSAGLAPDGDDIFMGDYMGDTLMKSDPISWSDSF